MTPPASVRQRYPVFLVIPTWRHFDCADARHLTERAAAEQAQLRTPIHYVSADASLGAVISPPDADSDLARLIRYLGNADPGIVRRLIEVVEDEGGMVLT